MFLRALFLLTLALATPAPESLAVDHFLRDIAGAQPKEDGLFTDGRFVLPNEHGFFVFDSQLKEKQGALLSVGTFRSLESASRGKFEHAILMDVDPGIVAFNDRQIEALRHSTSRGDFLAKLLGQPEKATFLQSILDNRPTPDSLKGIEAQLHKKTPEELQLDKLEARLRGLANEPAPTPAQVRELIAGLGISDSYGSNLLKDPQREDLESLIESQLRTKRFNLRIDHTLPKYVAFLLRTALAPEENQRSFLGDEARFQRVRGLAQTGRIYSTLGSLSDPAHMAELARRLAEKKISLSVVDVSNAPDYILRDATAGTTLSQNLRRLPLAENARVHLTSGQFPGERNPATPNSQVVFDEWRYFSLPAGEYARDVGGTPAATSNPAAAPLYRHYKTENDLTKNVWGPRPDENFLGDLAGKASPEGQLFQNGRYIVPNESSYHLFDESLKGKQGALISVGTFRSFEAASRGDFSHVVLMDVDPGIVDFNQRQVLALKQSRSPAEFLANLVGQPESAYVFQEALRNPADAQYQNVVDDLLAKVSGERRTESVRKLEDRINKLTARPNPMRADAEEIAKLLNEPDTATNIWNELKLHDGKDRARRFIRPLVERLKRDLDREPTAKYVRHLLKHATLEDKAKRNFLGDPERFRKVQRLADNGRIQAFRGDLVDEKIFSELGRRLRAQKVPVSVVDVSNAPDYFLHHEENAAAYRKNLASLPLTRNSTVNFTTHHLRNAVDAAGKSEQWHYFSVPSTEYLAGVDDFGGRRDPYRRLLEKLRGGPSDLTAAANGCASSFAALKTATPPAPPASPPRKPSGSPSNAALPSRPR